MSSYNPNMYQNQFQDSNNEGNGMMGKSLASSSGNSSYNVKCSSFNTTYLVDNNGFMISDSVEEYVIIDSVSEVKREFKKEDFFDSVKFRV